MVSFTSNGPDHSPSVHTHPEGMGHPWEGSPSAVYHTGGHYHRGRGAEGSHDDKDRRSHGEHSHPWGAGVATDTPSHGRHSSQEAAGGAPGSSHGTHLGKGRDEGYSPGAGHVGHSRRGVACTDDGLENAIEPSLAYLAGSALDVRMCGLIITAAGVGNGMTYVGKAGDRATLEVPTVKLLNRGPEISCTFKLDEP